MTHPPRRVIAVPRPTRTWVVILAAYLVVLTAVVVFFASKDDDPKPARSVLRFATSPASDPFPNLTETRVIVGDDELSVVIADDESERGQGLRERETIGKYDGMLFVYEDESERSFTMSTVPVPLDIGFYDSRGRLVNQLRMEPCAGSDAECPGYLSGAEFRYALETLAGDLPEGRLRAA